MAVTTWNPIAVWLLAIALGVASMLIVVVACSAMGLHHTWFPGGVVAFLFTSINIVRRGYAR